MATFANRTVFVRRLPVPPAIIWQKVLIISAEVGRRYWITSRGFRKRVAPITYKEAIVLQSLVKAKKCQKTGEFNLNTDRKIKIGHYYS